MKVITIKFDNAGEWNFLLELMKRLHINFEWKEESVVKNKAKPASDVVAMLFGSFPSDKSSDEFIQSLYVARINQTREIKL